MNLFFITGLKPMNFCYRLLDIISIILLIFISSGCTQEKDKNISTIINQNNFSRPNWVSQYPLVLAGNWDVMPLFNKRIGGNTAWQEESYKNEHTEAIVKKLKDMGVTLFILHFYKGFGIEAEKEQMEETKKLSILCKQAGIKVGVYIGSTIGYETFLLEEPEAKDWFVPDYLGQPVRYGGTQTFRKRVYFMHPGYIKYIKRVIKIAIEDLKVDLIHFDNTSMQAQPQIFFHPLAIEDFKAYLKNKYSPEMLKNRFGFSDVKYVEPPLYDKLSGKINDPLFQEWTDFRCQQLTNYYNIMAQYIHILNPEVAIDNNPHSGLSGNNTIWEQGVDYPRMLSSTDFVWTEEGNDATVTDEGVLVSKIRTYKMARTLNNRVFTYTSSNKLEMAQAMAYNQQGMGMVGGLREMERTPLEGAYDLPDEQKFYIKFYHNNFNYYRDIDNVADVAILHSFATMAYNNDLPYQSTFLFEQSLIQAKIPFDIIFDKQLENLSKYKVLVLADQECLSDEKMDVIKKFVNQGGGLVASEFSSLYTERRERKPNFGLKDIFKINAPEWKGKNYEEDFLKISVQKNLVGKGRVVYISEIKPSVPKPSGVAMTSNYWKLPLNNTELIESVKWASGNNLSVSIAAPQTITMELTQKRDKSATILHLVNFNYRDASVQNIKVDILVPEGKRVAQITVLTPDGRDDENLQFKENGGKVIFTVPKLSIYNMVVLKLE